MTIDHLEVFVEEPSMEAFLFEFLPRYLPENITFSIYTHSGKSDLLKKFPDRLLGYRSWVPDNYGIVVIVDRDDDSCVDLKDRLETCFTAAGFVTRKNSDGGPYSGLTRIAIEELEAWYFGNWAAVVRAFPRVSSSVANKARFRDSDAILGGTWEAFEQVCKQFGVFSTGLRKVDTARLLGQQVRIEENSSPSFRSFCDGILAMVSQA